MLSSAGKKVFSNFTHELHYCEMGSIKNKINNNKEHIRWKYTNSDISKLLQNIFFLIFQITHTLCLPLPPCLILFIFSCNHLWYFQNLGHLFPRVIATNHHHVIKTLDLRRKGFRRWTLKTTLIFALSSFRIMLYLLLYNVIYIYIYIYIYI